MTSVSNEPPKHQMRIVDQIHLNPAYLHNENHDKHQAEQLWMQHTKL